MEGFDSSSVGSIPTFLRRQEMRGLVHLCVHFIIVALDTQAHFLGFLSRGAVLHSRLAC